MSSSALAQPGRAAAPKGWQDFRHAELGARTTRFERGASQFERVPDAGAAVANAFEGVASLLEAVPTVLKLRQP